MILGCTEVVRQQPKGYIYLSLTDGPEFHASQVFYDASISMSNVVMFIICGFQN